MGGCLELGKRENRKVGEHTERNVRTLRTNSEGPASWLRETVDLLPFFYFGHAFVACSMWDLSSPTRDRTRFPCVGSVKS